MKIDQCQDPTLLSAPLDGELAPEQSVAVHSHLKTCEACQRQLDILRKSDAMVQQVDVCARAANRHFGGRALQRSDLQGELFR